MSVYLSIDPGLSHTGVAMADATRLVRPLITINSKKQEKIVSQLLSLIEKYQPDMIVIGQPDHGRIRLLAKELFQELQKKYSGELLLFSEDLSSKKSIIKLVQSGMSKQDRQKKQHSASAAIILEDYLESV